MNSSEICDVAVYLASDTVLRGILYFRVFIFITGIILFAVFFKVQGNYLAFHQNARLLLMSLYMWTMLLTATGLALNIFDIIRYSENYKDPCKYTLAAPISALLRGPSLWALCGSVWALVSMALERCIASVNYKTYEMRSNRIGKANILVQWLFSLLWVAAVLIDIDWSELKANATISSADNSQVVSLTLILLALIELLALGVFYYLLVYNRRKKLQLSSDASLTEKYQVQENIRAIKLMMPIVLCHCACSMPSLFLIPLYMRIYPDLDPRYYTLILEILNCAPYYSTLLPLVLIWRHKKLRDNLRHALELATRIEPIQGSEADQEGKTREQIHHFALLKTLFNPPDMR